MIANNARNVSYGKPKYGGVAYRAPIGTPLPESPDEPLDKAFENVGYLNEDEQKGVSGLELIHQDELAADGDVLTVLADGAGNIISGRAPAVRSGTEKARTMESRTVVTSIDRRLQYVCEKALSAAGESGAAVVMDVESGEILAWASMPKFDPRSIEDYLDDGDCLLDKVSQGTYAPGSVFKLVTAIAALESGVCDEEQEFTCEGEGVVAGVPVTVAIAAALYTPAGGVNR